LRRRRLEVFDVTWWLLVLLSLVFMCGSFWWADRLRAEVDDLPIGAKEFRARV